MAEQERTEQEQRHRDFHMIGDTIRRGRPSTVECPACSVKAARPAPDAAGPTTDAAGVAESAQERLL